MVLKTIANFFVFLLASLPLMAWLGYQLDIEKGAFVVSFGLLLAILLTFLAYKWQKTSISNSQIGKILVLVSGYFFLVLFLSLVGVGLWAGLMVSNGDEKFGEKILGFVDNPVTRFFIDIYGLRLRGITVALIEIVALIRLGGIWLNRK